MKKEQEEKVNQIEEILRGIIEGLEPIRSRKVGRPRIMPGLALWGGVLVGVLRGFSSQLEIHRLLNIHGLWDFPRYSLSDEAVYKRLRTADGNTFRRFFEAVTQTMKEEWRQGELVTHQLAPFASGVYAIDGSGLDKISKRLPSLREKEGTVLAGKITAVFDIRRQLWHGVSYHENVQQNDKVSARGDLEGIPTGSLLLFDMGYFSFPWFDHLKKKGYYWISRMREKTSYEVIHTLYKDSEVSDQLIWLGAYRADRAKFPVRMVEIRYRGGTQRYLTNVEDPGVLSVLEMVKLYRRRWDIEMMFNMVKTHLGLHFLFSSQPNVFLHQVFAVFTISQVILGLRNEVACEARVDVTEISLATFVTSAIAIAQKGDNPVTIIAQYGRIGGIIRPSTRLEVKIPPIDPSLIQAAPPGLIRVRKPRYAGKNRTVKGKSRTVEVKDEPVRKRGRPRKNPI